MDRAAEKRITSKLLVQAVGTNRYNKAFHNCWFIVRWDAGSRDCKQIPCGPDDYFVERRVLAAPPILLPGCRQNLYA